MKIFAEEYEKRMKQNELKSFKDEEDIFLENIKSIPTINSAKVLSAYEYAKGLDYHKHGSYENYMNHIIRMCNLYTELCKNHQDDIFITILVHNVYDASDVTFEALSQKLGAHIASYVQKLVVNRDLEWDEKYQENYYNNISGDEICSIIKVIDKIDNVFLLCEYPDKTVRINYVKEIKKHLIPLAKKQINFPDADKLIEEILVDVEKRI